MVDSTVGDALDGVGWRLAAVMLLVLANGFFVAAEFGLVGVRGWSTGAPSQRTLTRCQTTGSGRLDRADPRVLHPPSQPVGELIIGEALHHPQRQVNAGRHAPTGDEIAVVDDA